MFELHCSRMRQILGEKKCETIKCLKQKLILNYVLFMHMFVQNTGLFGMVKVMQFEEKNFEGPSQNFF